MLYLDYAKQTENGYIMNFFANSIEDLEDISEGKEFVTKNGTNYGVPAPQSVVTITNKNGEKTTYLMGEDGNWIPGVVNPTDYYTKKQTDAKLDEKEDKITDINLTEAGTTVTYDLTDGITLNSTARLTSNEKTHDATMKLELPIVPGTGISIDKKENSESIGISIDGDAYVKLGGIKMYTDVGATGTYIHPGNVEVHGTPGQIKLKDIRNNKAVYLLPKENYKSGDVILNLPPKSGTLATTDDIPAEGVDVYIVSTSGGYIAGDAPVPVIQFDYDTYAHPNIRSDPGIAGNRRRLIMPTPLTKTLFGNQSILGSGNIDLYRHTVFFNSDDDTIHNCCIVFYSSLNTNCNSLTDLKTILGNAFTVPATGFKVGSSGVGVICDVDSVNGVDYVLDNAQGSIPWSNITTILDTVTTI